MYYKMLKTGELKIVLSSKDLAKDNISIMDSEEEECSLFFQKVFAEAEEATTFPRNRSSLIIEITPTRTGGCVAIYTAIGKQGEKLYPTLLYIFSDITSLYDVIKLLSNVEKECLSYISSYQDEGIYYLIIEPKDKLCEISSLLCEFGEEQEEITHYNIAYIKEHYKRLF